MKIKILLFVFTPICCFITILILVELYSDLRRTQANQRLLKYEEAFVEEPCTRGELNGLTFIIKTTRTEPRAVCLVSAELNPAGCFHLMCPNLLEILQ